MLQERQEEVFVSQLKMCVCACVCVERWREGERQGGRERGREKERRQPDSEYGFWTDLNKYSNIYIFIHVYNKFYLFII